MAEGLLFFRPLLFRPTTFDHASPDGAGMAGPSALDLEEEGPCRCPGSLTRAADPLRSPLGPTRSSGFPARAVDALGSPSGLPLPPILTAAFCAAPLALFFFFLLPFPPVVYSALIADGGGAGGEEAAFLP